MHDRRRSRHGIAGKMSSIDFDEVLVHVGEKGRYQNIMYYLLCIPATLPAAFLAFSQVSKHGGVKQRAKVAFVFLYRSAIFCFFVFFFQS